MRYRGIVRNDSERPIFVLADRGFFIESETDLREAGLSLPPTIDGRIYLLEAEQAALFEWFGCATVIDWLELARAGAGVEDTDGIHAPFTEIGVNYAGDQNFARPSLRIKLQLERHPVFIPTFGREDEEDPVLQILGPDGRVDCLVKKSYPRLPRTFADLSMMERRLH